LWTRGLLREVGLGPIKEVKELGMGPVKEVDIREREGGNCCIL
jgi:hypothetical protein